MKFTKSQSAFFEIFFNASREEYETILQLPLKLRVMAVLGLVCLYTIAIILIHVVIRPFLMEGIQPLVLLIVVYILFFLGFLGVYLLTILTPSIEKYFNKIFVLSLVLAAAGGLFLGVDLGMAADGANRNFIFREVPDAASLVLLLVGYSLLLLGIRLYGNTLYKVNRQKAEVEMEIQIARKIHDSIIRDIDINDNDFTAYGKIIPAKEVGGDYIDLMKINDHTAVMAIGDVSGHDVGSGLLMAMAKSAFYSELKYNWEIDKIMYSLNETVYHHSRRDMFISFLSAVFNFEEKKVYVTNAGHFPLLIRRKADDSIEKIKPSGLVLGVLPDSHFEVSVTDFSPGDLIIGFTDGLIEARNTKKEEFGLDRLTAEIQKVDNNLSSKAIYNFLLELSSEFSSTDVLRDDVSLIVMKIS